jgi:2-C-methyl-D-erythritol 4-phosphate cytidylyltransferase
MLGLIVVANPSNAPGTAALPMEDLVGVPVLARAIAGALPTDESVTGVLVVDEGREDDMREKMVARFAFDEIDRVVASAPSFVAAVSAGLDALGDDVDYVIVQDGRAGLVPSGLVDRVVAAARAGEAAAPAVELAGHVVADEGDGLVPLDIRSRLRRVQSPQVFKRETLRQALLNPPATDASGELHLDDAAAAVAAAGGTVALVLGDVDNHTIVDGADVGRAVEVFARRAVDFPFVYPRDLLPEDPLKAAIDAASSSDGHASSGHDSAEST